MTLSTFWQTRQLLSDSARQAVERPTLSRYLGLGGLLLAMVLAYCYSFLTLWQGGTSDTPAAITAYVPVMALFLFNHCLRGAVPRRGKRDFFLDTSLTLLLLGLSGYLLLLLPAKLSGYFWLYRLDLVTVPLIFLALTTILWGLGGTVKLLPVAGYLFLAWPIPYIAFLQTSGRFFTRLTGVSTAFLMRLLPLHYTQQIQSGDYLFILHTPRFGAIALLLSSACAGLNAFLGVVVIGLPVLLIFRGPLANKVLWLACGIVVCWLANLFRIILLFICTYYAGDTLGFELLHPELGLLLFASSFFALLLLSPRFGLTHPHNQPINQLFLYQAKDNHRLSSLPTRLLWVMILSVGLGVQDTLLTRYDWMSRGLPAVSLQASGSQLPEIPGWRLTYEQELSNFTAYFGSTSHSAVYSYSRDTTLGRQVIWVQTVLTPNYQALVNYSVENCYIFHGYQIHSVRQIPIGYGMTSLLLNYDITGSHTSATYWIQPVKVESKLYSQRIVLINAASPDQAMIAPDGKASALPQQSSGTRPVWSSLVTPYGLSQETSAYTGSDAIVTEVARLIADQETTSPTLA